MVKKEIPVYDIVISDDDIDMIVGMGFVKTPAIGVDFQYFNNDINVNYNKYTFDEFNEEQIAVGPALIPDKKIIRPDAVQKYKYIRFDKDVIKRLAHGFLKNNLQHTTTEQHKETADDIYLFESWIIVNEYDKLYTEYGYSPDKIPLGTWCVMYKVENQDIWDKIKTNEINGFSIEAYLSEVLSPKSELEKLFESVTKEDLLEELQKMGITI